MLGNDLHGPNDQMGQAIHVEWRSENEDISTVGRGEQLLAWMPFIRALIRLERAAEEQRLWTAAAVNLKHLVSMAHAQGTDLQVVFRRLEQQPEVLASP